MKDKFLIAIPLLALVIGATLYVYGLPAYNDYNNVAITDATRKADDEVEVYETEAESEADCTSYEQYDSEHKVCYYKCKSDAECKQIEQNINDELAGWLDDNQEDYRNSKSESDDDLEQSIKSRYGVSSGESIKLLEGNATPDDKRIWQHVSNISPDALSDKYIEEYTVFDNKDSDTLAFVDDIDMNGKWRVAINRSGYNSSSVRERNITIIHELGHIITLNTSEVVSMDESTCPNYFTAEGCAQPNSYLNKFVKEFWSKSDIKSTVSGKDVYKDGKFVTEYAASNPEEDLAESFAYFVIDNKKSDAEIKDKKIAFFYHFPEAIEIRNAMRQGVYSDIMKGKRSVE